MNSLSSTVSRLAIEADNLAMSKFGSTLGNNTSRNPNIKFNVNIVSQTIKE